MGEIVEDVLAWGDVDADIVPFLGRQLGQAAHRFAVPGRVEGQHAGRRAQAVALIDTRIATLNKDLAAAQGEAGLTFIAGSELASYVESIGADNTGLMKLPATGEGPFKDQLASTSQTLAITSWASDDQKAVAGLVANGRIYRFLHKPVSPARRCASPRASRTSQRRSSSSPLLGSSTARLSFNWPSLASALPSQVRSSGSDAWYSRPSGPTPLMCICCMFV